MAEEIVMPRLSDTMEEGTIARWLKREGDPVKKGEPILEVETDKATMELPAYSDGVLARILVREGATVPLGAPIGMLAKAGEHVSPGTSGAPPAEQPPAADAGAPSTEQPPTQAAPAAAQEQPAEQSTPPGSAGVSPAAPDSAASSASPEEASRPAPDPLSRRERDGVRAAPPPNATGDGRQPPPGPPPTVSGGPAAFDQQAEAKAEHQAAESARAPEPPERAETGARPAGRPEAESDGGHLRASPVARRLAEEHDLDLTPYAGQGSGPGGRIVLADVGRFLQQPRAAAPPSTPAPSADVELRQVSRVHQVMARRTQESFRDVPHFYLSLAVDMTAALALRRQLQESLGEEGKVSLNDLVLRATALALRAVPEVNSSWQDGRLALHQRVHLGMAVAVPDGLVVPVIHDADTRTVRQIGAEARRLAARAREGKLAPADLEGGTFTVSNLGMFEVEEFLGVINPPQAGLLAVGAALEQPVAVDGQVVVRSRMRVTLSADHRAYSGDVGARFLQALRTLLQEPLRLGF